MFNYYNHLGFFNPYYFYKEGEIHLASTFSETVTKYNKPLKMDLTAVIELLNKNYIFGDRTLIKGIKTSPWMAKLNDNNKGWDYACVPDHKENVLEEKEIAETFFGLIQEEIIKYVENKDSIGILLSGGMDSRIVAGTLDYLLQNGKISVTNVTALTWGNKKSRDIVYAKEIASRLDWNWKHFPLDAKGLLENIDETAKQGCRYSPIHLHAMPKIREEKEIDCILAGSFGDSIGRAEYSGMKVQNLKPLSAGFRNAAGFLKENVFKDYQNKWLKDLGAYHKLFPQKKKYQQYEQDYQIHYWRKMLNPCMAVINERIPLHQVFTAPAVYGFMWSIIPKKRTDKIYSYIMQQFVTPLDDIPWARTGRMYGTANSETDSLEKKCHSYAQLISRSIHFELKNMVLSEPIRSLEIFNMDVLKKALYWLNMLPKDKNIYYGEKLIWIAALYKMIKKFDLKADSYKYTLEDKIKPYFYTPIDISARTLKQTFLSK